MLKAELKVSGGTHAGKVIPLARQRFLIGRGDDCQLRPASEQISRHHCVFSIDDFTVRLRDLGSTNGTFVNDAPLHGEVILKHGDKVRVGALDFQMQISDEQVSYDAAAVPDVAQSLLPKDLAADTAEMAATETALNLPAASTETQSGAAASASETTIAPPPEQPATPAAAPSQPQPVPAGAAQGQPYPPGAMPYPQAPYPYMPQPGMAYPPQPYPYPGYMPMPGQYPPAGQYPQYPPAGQYPQADAPSSAPASTQEMPTRLPPPESTGAVAPEAKPPAAAESGVPHDPSTMAADIIKKMRNRRPGASS